LHLSFNVAHSTASNRASLRSMMGFQVLDRQAIQFASYRAAMGLRRFGAYSAQPTNTPAARGAYAVQMGIAVARRDATVRFQKM